MATFALNSALLNKMDVLQQKLNVHSYNLSRSQVPGSKTLELKNENFTQKIQQPFMNMAVTHPAHIVSPVTSPNLAGDIRKKGLTNEVRYSGNNIDSEEEMKEINSTSLQHQEIALLYHKYYTFLNEVISSH